VLLVTQTVASLGSGTSLTVTRTCPTGKKVLGGCYTYSLSSGVTERVDVVSSYPSAGNAWTVALRANQNLNSAVTLSVYAVCTV
jgi:hypothetical protein